MWRESAFLPSCTTTTDNNNNNKHIHALGALSSSKSGGREGDQAPQVAKEGKYTSVTSTYALGAGTGRSRLTFSHF